MRVFHAPHLYRVRARRQIGDLGLDLIAAHALAHFPHVAFHDLQHVIFPVQPERDLGATHVGQPVMDVNGVPFYADIYVLPGLRLREGRAFGTRADVIGEAWNRGGG